MSIDRWVNREDVIYIYMNIWNGVLVNHKKEWNNAICNNMDGHRDYHTKWSKPKINTLCYFSYVNSKNHDMNELIYKTEIDSQT